MSSTLDAVHRHIDENFDRTVEEIRRFISHASCASNGRRSWPLHRSCLPIPPDPIQARLGDSAVSRYWDEFCVGEEFQTPGRTITESDVITFAQLSGDQNQLHTNVEYCRSRGFTGLVPQTNLIIALASGLIARLGLFDAQALGLIGLEWRVHERIEIGDTLSCRVRIAAMSARDDAVGSLRREVEVVNQRLQVVQSGHHDLLLRRKEGTQT